MSDSAPHITWCDRSLFEAPLYYGFAANERSFHKELRRMGVRRKDWPPYLNDGAGATAHFFEKGDKCSVIVCLKASKKYTGIQIAALLVHEAVHIWQHIRNAIGEKNPGSESEAYAIQRISQSLMYAYAESLGGKIP